MPPIPQREIWDIVVHCADSANGKPVSVAEIDQWHRERTPPFRRVPYWRNQLNQSLTSIGYQFVIDVDGTVHTGRHIDEIPAQAAGHNSKGVGICLVGRDKFTPMQWASLKALVIRLQTDIKASAHKVTPRVIGHHDYTDSHKTCPNFDVIAWAAAGMEPPADHVLKA